MTSPPLAKIPAGRSLLVRLSTVLYQQQCASEEGLAAHLAALNLPSPVPEELFLKLCDRFPYSHRPLHRFIFFARASLYFSHSPTTLAKFLVVLRRSNNVDLLWSSLLAHIPLLSSPDVLLAAVRSLAASRQINKCARLFALLPPTSASAALNLAVASLCDVRLVGEAAALVSKLRPSIPPDGDTYSFLIVGFCRAGDLATALRTWNRAVEAGFDPRAAAYEETVLTFFKSNRPEDAMRMFKTLRNRRPGDMGIESYGPVIDRLCKLGSVRRAHMMFGEMTKRGIVADHKVLGSMIYGLVAKRKVREAYNVLEGVPDPDLSLFHGMLKGLLRLKRRREATEVFREMISRGVEPSMHTYVMMLQGHMGKRGRKGNYGAAVDFDAVFVGGLVKAGRVLEAGKYVERTMGRSVEVPRFDYNRFLHCFSNEEGVAMFEDVGRKMRTAGLVDLADVFMRYGEKMATRGRRRNRTPPGPPLVPIPNNK